MPSGGAILGPEPGKTSGAAAQTDVHTTAPHESHSPKGEVSETDAREQQQEYDCCEQCLECTCMVAYEVFTNELGLDAIVRNGTGALLLQCRMDAHQLCTCLLERNAGLEARYDVEVPACPVRRVFSRRDPA